MTKPKMVPKTPVLLLVGASLLASGCLPLHATRVHHHPAPEEVIVPGPPPEPKEEDPGTCPEDGWVWLGGHWKFEDGNYRWDGGNWEPPREDVDYVPPTHRQTERGWVYRPPHWRKHRKHRKHGHGEGHDEHKGEPGDPDTPDKVRVSAPPAGDEPGDEGSAKEPRPDGDPMHGAGETGRHPAPPAGEGQDGHLPRYDRDKIKTQRDGPPVDNSNRGKAPGSESSSRKPAPHHGHGVRPGGATRHKPAKPYKGTERGHRPGAHPRKPPRNPHRGTGGLKTRPPKPVKRPGHRPGEATRHKPAKPYKRHDRGHRPGTPSRAKKPAPPRRKKPGNDKRGGGDVVKGKIAPEAPGKPRVKPPEGPQVPARGKRVQHKR